MKVGCGSQAIRAGANNGNWLVYHAPLPPSRPEVRGQGPATSRECLALPVSRLAIVVWGCEWLRPGAPEVLPIEMSTPVEGPRCQQPRPCCHSPWLLRAATYETAFLMSSTSTKSLYLFIYSSRMGKLTRNPHLHRINIQASYYQLGGWFFFRIQTPLKEDHDTFLAVGGRK